MKPLLFPGQVAEWITLGPPSPEDVKGSWLARAALSSNDPALSILPGAAGGIVCGAAGCGRVLREKDRALAVTTPPKPGRTERKLWFCSTACQRRTHLAAYSGGWGGVRFPLARRTRR